MIADEEREQQMPGINAVTDRQCLETESKDNITHATGSN